jgi:hypothetical protein
MPDGSALLDIRPDGAQWRWASVPVANARVGLAVGIAAISGGWKVYISLPDDPTSNALEIIGLAKTRDPPDSAGTPAGLILHVSVSPTPREGTQANYTVAVTDASATPIDQAVVSLHNFTAAGADEMHTQNTAAGRAVFQNITLHSKRTTDTIGGGGDGPVRQITIVTRPSLAVTKDGFASVQMNLL